MKKTIMIAAGLVWSAGVVHAQELDPIEQAIAEREAALGLTTDAVEEAADVPTTTADPEPVAASADAVPAEGVDPIDAAIAEQEAALGLGEPSVVPVEEAAAATADDIATEPVEDLAIEVSDPMAPDAEIPGSAPSEAAPAALEAADAPTVPDEGALAVDNVMDADGGLAEAPLPAPTPAVVAAPEPAPIVESAPTALPHDMADVLVMPPEAEVHFITTGGMQLRADWTEAALSNFSTHLPAEMEGRGYTVVQLDSEDVSEEVEQLLLLQELVALSNGLPMPHKTEFKGANLGLTLGPSAVALADLTGSDTALFLDHLSRIESSGVFLANVAVGTATGLATGVATVPMSGAIRTTTVQAIDLTTGNVIDTQTVAGGDPRDLDESRGIVNRLLKRLDLGED